MPATATTTRRLATLLVTLAIGAAGCGSTTSPAPVDASSGPSASAARPASAAPSGAGSDDLAPLIAAAEAEGNLTVIGLAHDWCNYGEALTTFTTRYAIKLNELNQDAGFGDQVAAIKATRDKGPGAPDVIDVGVSFAAKAKADGLLAPYKVGPWDTIPDVAKDPAGAWTGDYYGVLAFETNTTNGNKVPADWSDLLAPGRTDQLTLAGDPRVSGQAIETVYAAALANGGSLDNAAAGLDYFAKLKKAGRLSERIASPD